MTAIESKLHSRSLRVLVTGAGGGMSAGIIEVLTSAGHTVLCVDRDEAAANAAARKSRARGGDAYHFEVDVTDEAAVLRLREQIYEQFGGIDVLVNAAGMNDRKYVMQHDSESFERTVNVNLNGAVRMIRLFSDGLVKQGWGRIINIASMAGVVGYQYPAYAASKAALAHVSSSLVLDFWGTGVTVNAICPGVVDTPMASEAARSMVAKKVPTQTMVSPQEIGELVLFLASAMARNVNGARLVIDGGATAAYELVEDRPVWGPN